MSYISEYVQLYFNMFWQSQFQDEHECDEMMLGTRSCRRGREQWALAWTLLVGTKGNCRWICSWPCEPCAYLPEVVYARSGHSVGRWVGPRDPLIQVRTSSMAVLFGKRSRPERLRRVLRSPSWSRVLVAVQSCLMGGGLKSHGEWVWFCRFICALTFPAAPVMSWFACCFCACCFCCLFVAAAGCHWMIGCERILVV